jgi:competence protein ComEA
MKTGWLLVYGILIGLLAGGLVYVSTRPPRGTPVTLSPAPTAAPLMVHVSGAVLQPGMYALPPGSRVRDAVQISGGFTGDADAGAINLAALVQDGQKIQIPSKVKDTPVPPAASNPVATPASGKINLNTASQAELESLPRIGPALAERIIAYRTEHGPFASLEAIMEVVGIGEGIYAAIKDLITLDAP